MDDMPCIYQMNMVDENGQMEQDILAGRGMDVLFCMMDNAKTKLEIASRLEMPSYSVQLYLDRLQKAGLVKEESSIVQNGQIEKCYQLASDEIKIINMLQRETMTEAEKKRKVDISAHHFGLMTRNAIKNANIYADKPNKIKAYFMRAKEEDMREFRKEIEALFEKYQSLEDKNATDTYSLFTVLAPSEKGD